MRNALRQSETDRGIDADTLIGRFLDCRNSRLRDRDLHDHVWREFVKLLGLFQNRLAVPK